MRRLLADELVIVTGAIIIFMSLVFAYLRAFR
jgi:hypothetical protein